MSDDRGDAGLVEIGGHEDGRIRIGIVVTLNQFQRAAPDAALGVNLLYRQFRCMFHGQAHGIAQRAGQPDPDRITSAAAPADEKQRERREEEIGCSNGLTGHPMRHSISTARA